MPSAHILRALPFPPLCRQANYALSKATSEPNGFKCTSKGKKNGCCHCWNKRGDPHDWEDDCHSPKQCLAYDIKNAGTFKFGALKAGKSIPDQLKAWKVPTQMYTTFEAAALVESSIFQAFKFTVEAGENGLVEANVGTARKFNGTVQLGYAYGKATADLVQPYAGGPVGADCHGTSRGMHKRGYTNDELTMIVEGLTAYAFKQSAHEAYPSLAATAVPVAAAAQEIPLVAADVTSVAFCGCKGDCYGQMCDKAADVAGNCGGYTGVFTDGEKCSAVCAEMDGAASPGNYINGCAGTFSVNGGFKPGMRLRKKL